MSRDAEPRRCYPGRMRMLIGLAAAVCAPALVAQSGSEYLVVFGSGYENVWRTEFTVTNPTDSLVSVYLARAPDIEVCPPLIQCVTTADVPGRGTVALDAPYGSGVGLAYLKTLDSSAVPAVFARATRGGSFVQSLDLPVFHLSTLLALNPSKLAFPGAARGSAGYCNLLLANLADPLEIAPDVVEVRLTVYDATGASLASKDVTLTYGVPLLIVDVVGFLGVASLELGQLSVSRIGGDGKYWGIMPVIRSDGSLSISLGTAP